MTTITNVALIGASGNLGPSILNAFLEDGSFKITVISRSSSTATFPDGVRVLKIDYSPSSLISAFQGQDAVVSIAGAQALEDQKKYIDAAAEAGVKRFIPSEFGTDLTNPKTVELVPLFKSKVAVTDYLKTKESESFSWTALVTGPFFDWGMKVGFLGFNLKDHTAEIWDDGETPVSVSNLALIGKAVVRVLLPQHLSATKNHDVFVASFTVTQNQILKELEKLTGEKWKTTTIESAPVLEKSTAAYKAGDYSPGVVYSLVKVANLGKGLGNLGDHAEKVWNEKLGLPRESLETTVKALLDA